MQKLDRHFLQWSKRHLSLLGRIQIYKTFGLSQFLYHLAVCELGDNDWKAIYNKIYKFLWNRNYAGNLAPDRIKREVLYSSIKRGGFGMLDIKEVVTALRLHRHFILLRNNNLHPMSELIAKLSEGIGYLGIKPLLEVDEILKLNLKALNLKRLNDYKAPDWILETDLILQANLLQSNILDLTRPRKRGSQELRQLTQRGLMTLTDVHNNSRQCWAKLLKITDKSVTKAITIIGRLYRDQPLPNQGLATKILYNGRWVEDSQLSSRSLRDALFDQRNCSIKITTMEDDIKASYFSKLSKLVNVANKSRMLRLLQGDVYCAERTYRFGLSESDKCRRCFEIETIQHLLCDCPYTREVFSLIGINSQDINEILGVSLGRSDLEIRADFLNYLIFRQHILPPEILVQTTLEKFEKGLAGIGKMSRVAGARLRALPSLQV
jgi:hypothetical protein